MRAKAYDIVLNGTEVGGGSLRIHDSALQAKIFQLLSLTDEEAKERFGFFLEALQYGTPPHGGIALGLDRIVMILAGESSLRDVIAFPKTASATDLMSGSPSPVRDDQLRELGIVVIRDLVIGCFHAGGAPKTTFAPLLPAPSPPPEHALRRARRRAMKRVALPEQAAEALFGNHDENLRFLEDNLKVRIKNAGHRAGRRGHERGPGDGRARSSTSSARS